MRYKYQALDQQAQEVSGFITADTEREAARELKKRDLTVLTLTQTIDKKEKSAAKKAGKPKQRDVIVVLHELTTLLESGVSLIEAVESLAQSSHHPALVENFAQVASQLRHGATFSVALKETNLDLPWYMYQLLEAGELTGKVAEALRDGVKQLEYDHTIKTEMRNAMIYPSILIISGISAILLIFIVVVPRFASILKNKAAADMPFLAKAVLNSGMFLNNHVEWVIGIIVIIVTLLILIFKQAGFKRKFRDMLSRTPIIGVWLVESETARWSSMMATLLENKVSLLRALELASEGMSIPSLQARLQQVSKAVRGGVPLSQALQENDALNATGHNLISAGERAGELPRMMHSLAKLLEESGRTRMKRFLLLIEPIAILLIGGVIGVVITGVMLAITSVNQISF